MKIYTVLDSDTISYSEKQRYPINYLRYQTQRGACSRCFITLNFLPMARYTNFFMTGAPKEEVHPGLVGALEGCGLDLVYQDPVYIVAKEKPGQVSFAQLTTVELMLNPPTTETVGAKIDLVVKNEELPLRQQNHCREVFTLVNQAIAEANAQATSEVSASTSVS